MTLKQGTSRCKRVGSYTRSHRDASQPAAADCETSAVPTCFALRVFDFSPVQALKVETRNRVITYGVGALWCMPLSDEAYPILVLQPPHLLCPLCALPCFSSPDHSWRGACRLRPHHRSRRREHPRSTCRALSNRRTGRERDLPMAGPAAPTGRIADATTSRSLPCPPTQPYEAPSRSPTVS